MSDISSISCQPFEGNRKTRQRHLPSPTSLNRAHTLLQPLFALVGVYTRINPCSCTAVKHLEADRSLADSQDTLLFVPIIVGWWTLISSRRCRESRSMLETRLVRRCAASLHVCNPDSDGSRKRGLSCGFLEVFEIPCCVVYLGRSFNDNASHSYCLTIRATVCRHRSAFLRGDTRHCCVPLCSRQSRKGWM
ncbi:hypothetical protein BDW22DRAFT_846399 [Trametopsis cervina]|nr:hypothetical protein BDW22DRAFT_846399 [Trametopsis cervina]